MYILFIFKKNFNIKELEELEETIPNKVYILYIRSGLTLNLKWDLKLNKTQCNQTLID